MALKSAIQTSKICGVTSKKLYLSSAGQSSSIFYLPAYGEKHSELDYVFKGKLFEKLGATGAIIENPYTDEQNRLVSEKNLFQDFKSVVEANQELQNEPKFIMGHSLGALYALRFC